MSSNTQIAEVWGYYNLMPEYTEIYHNVQPCLCGNH